VAVGGGGVGVGGGGVGVGAKGVGVGGNEVGVGDRALVGRSSSGVASGGDVGLGGTGVMVGGAWVGVVVGVSVEVEGGVKVGRNVASALGEGGSPRTKRATPGIFLMAHTAPIEMATKNSARTRTIAMIPIFRFTKRSSLSLQGVVSQPIGPCALFAAIGFPGQSSRSVLVQDAGWSEPVSGQTAAIIPWPRQDSNQLRPPCPVRLGRGARQQTF
jgi:hypothetical protein